MVLQETTTLAPGFRFHPTDEELVCYYLRRKVCGRALRFDAISDIDIYKAEPWDLPCRSKLKTRDLEWYFFSVLDKKYGNGSRTNRATERGYWKTTGKDRAVYHKSQVMGMKKTLVYHCGRAPRGERTNWVMHEYRLVDVELEKAGTVQDGFVLCRVFQKSGSGPKNGEQYGAPFVEEEWEDDELVTVPKKETAEEVEFGDDVYLDGNDLDQILGSDIPSDDAHPPLDLCPGENAPFVEGTADTIDDSQKLLVGCGEYDCAWKQSDDQKSFDLPVDYEMLQNQVKNEYMGEPSKTENSVDIEYLLDEQYQDATDNLHFGDGAFLEANDLSYPIDADTSAFDMLEDYLTYFDANGEISDFVVSDPLMMGASQDLVSGQEFIAQKDVEEGNLPVMSGEQFLEHCDVASSSKQEPVRYDTEFQYPFIKQASQMLGSFPAPPAFASEFPSKDAVLYLNSASQASSSVHVTAGMIQVRKSSVGVHGTDLFPGKHGVYNITLSFGLSRGEDNSTTLESVVRILPGKTASGVSNSWFYFIFFWVLILSVSFKIGTLICAS